VMAVWSDRPGRPEVLVARDAPDSVTDPDQVLAEKEEIAVWAAARPLLGGRARGVAGRADPVRQGGAGAGVTTEILLTSAPKPGPSRDVHSLLAFHPEGARGEPVGGDGWTTGRI
jgi:hypothetical protein